MIYTHSHGSAARQDAGQEGVAVDHRSTPGSNCRRPIAPAQTHDAVERIQISRLWSVNLGIDPLNLARWGLTALCPIVLAGGICSAPYSSNLN